jgi:hypothetical protein
MAPRRRRERRLPLTPSFSFYKARRDMALSLKLDFDHLFLLYYIFMVINI